MSISPRHDTKSRQGVQLLRFPIEPEKVVRTDCPGCHSPLTLVQPDIELPDRLVGICQRCKHWYLIDVIPALTQGTMLRLPDVRVIRELSQESPSDGISVLNSEQDAEGES